MKYSCTPRFLSNRAERKVGRSLSGLVSVGETKTSLSKFWSFSAIFLLMTRDVGR